MAALFASQPDIASTVDVAPIPDGVTPVRGRDGSDTFLIATEGGRRSWFGQSSMPTISAHETLAGFHSDGGSVSLPGILTGLEPLVLAGKIPDHCAVFVLEEDPLQIKLAMRLYDYEDLISAGRLVFLLEDELDESLRAFFESHPGYALPTRLVNVPHHSAAQIADRQRRLENAGEAVAEVVNRSVEFHARALGERTFGPLPETPRIAVVGTDPRPLSLEQARRADRALRRLQWPHDLCIPDAPANCHMVARLRAIERVSADLVLIVNACAGQLQSVLPPDFPVVSWFLPGADVHAVVGKAQTPNHVIFGSSRTIREQLIQAGVQPDQVELCDPAADDTTYRPVTLTPEELEAWSADVAVLMDRPDDRPEASNVVLESHLSLWRALQSAVLRNPDRYRDEIADDLLEEAQRASGTTLHEGSVRDHFMALLKTRIAPACVARAAVDALIADGHRVAVWGAHWTRVHRERTIARGAIPVGDDLNRIFNATSIVVFPELSAWAVQTALDALAAGAYALCRFSAESFCREYPGLADLESYLHFYRSRHDLTEIVRSVRSVAGTPAGRAEAARSIVLDKHTVSHRLQAITSRLREREAVSTPTER